MLLHYTITYCTCGGTLQRHTAALSSLRVVFPDFFSFYPTPHPSNFPSNLNSLPLGPVGLFFVSTLSFFFALPLKDVLRLKPLCGTLLRRQAGAASIFAHGLWFIQGAL